MSRRRDPADREERDPVWRLEVRRERSDGSEEWVYDSEWARTREAARREAFLRLGGEEVRRVHLG